LNLNSFQFFLVLISYNIFTGYFFYFIDRLFCNVTRQTINAIEAAKYSPSLEVAFKIATVFGVPIEEVFKFRVETEKKG
jgi:putative transcriptional regulator